jgi:ribosomal protein S18 acetylase RimI-like enzyme
VRPGSGPHHPHHPPLPIRLIRPEEHEEVARVLLAAYEADYAVGGRYRADILDVAGRARDHETWVVLDRHDGERERSAGPAPRILGTVTTGRPGQLITSIGRPGELDFRLLGVDPSARRRGVGRALTEHVLDLARARGARRVVMNSGGQMHPAHRLYESMGFSVLHERVRVLENGHVSLAYGIDLPATA